MYVKKLVSNCFPLTHKTSKFNLGKKGCLLPWQRCSLFAWGIMSSFLVFRWLWGGKMIFCINNPSHYISIKSASLYLRCLFLLQVFCSFHVLHSNLQVLQMTLQSSLHRFRYCDWHFHSYGSVIGLSWRCVWGWCLKSCYPLITGSSLVDVSCLHCCRHSVNERVVFLHGVVKDACCTT